MFHIFVLIKQENHVLMKKLLFILFSGIFSLSCYSQISVLKTSNVDPIHKPAPYDSLQPRMLDYDLKDSYNYLRYLGQKLVFLPMSDKKREEFVTSEFITEKYQRIKSVGQKVNIYKPIALKSGHITTNPAALENKSFLIVNVWSENKTSVTSGTQILDTISVYKVPGTSQLVFQLLDEDNNALYWCIRRSYLNTSNYIIQGYYDKQLQQFKNHEMVYMGDESKEFVDITTGESVKIEKKSPWICKDITLTEGDPWYKLCYVFSSNAGKTVSVNDGRGAFWSTEEYEKHVEEERLLREKEEIKRQEEEIKREKEEQRLKKMNQEFAEAMVSRFGKKNAELILQKKVALGMTKEMCKIAWGTPQNIVQNANIESWIYSYSTFLYFSGDKLIQIVQ